MKGVGVGVRWVRAGGRVCIYWVWGLDRQGKCYGILTRGVFDPIEM